MAKLSRGFQGFGYLRRKWQALRGFNKTPKIMCMYHVNRQATCVNWLDEHLCDECFIEDQIHLPVTKEELDVATNVH